MFRKYRKEIAWLAHDKYGGLPDPTSVPEKDIERILNGEPVDYVVGWKPFLNCKIDLSKRPLIPRPETEYWTEQFILSHGSKVKSRKLKVLDMFSGSGCIGIAILKHIPNAHVDFADYDSRCIAQIKINLKKNGIALSRARIIRSDVFTNIPTFCRMLECRPLENSYDAIVANPPYVPGKNRKLLPKSVLNFEPHIAVFGGNDGLRYVKTFLRDARMYLNPGGEIWMEFDIKEKPAIVALAKKYSYSKCEFKKDQYGKVRYAVLK